MLRDTPGYSATEPQTLVLCSSCFDQLGERILAIIPQSNCAVCEKQCLGYQTTKEVR